MEGKPMSRIVYVNGDYVDEAEAKVSVFDRGFLMADGVYEVTSVLDGKLIDFAGHAARLKRAWASWTWRRRPATTNCWRSTANWWRRNGVVDGLVYLQITRGNPGDRDFAFPDPAQVPSTLVMFTQSKPGLADSPAARRPASR